MEALLSSAGMLARAYCREGRADYLFAFLFVLPDDFFAFAADPLLAETFFVRRFLPNALSHPCENFWVEPTRTIVTTQILTFSGQRGHSRLTGPQRPRQPHAKKTT